MNGADASLSLSGVLKSAFWGAVSGAVTFGIGSCFTATASAANSAVAFGMQNARFLLQAAVHGVAQGTLAMVQSGGSGFFSGATAGFFGSMGATAWSAGVGVKFASSAVGTIAFGALSGGVGAEMAGGNFWQGAVTGGIVAGLNHVMHMESNPDNGHDENGKQINNNGGDTTDYMYDKDGNIISSTSVEFKGAMSQSEFRELGGFRGYGFKGFSMATGAIAEDNTIFELFTGGNLIKGAGKSFKFLRASGGKINGFSISRGAGYGAKGRFDFHKLVNTSKRSNTFPNWVKGKTLPHYHRGAGNNLHRHRPWEKGWNDKSFWDLF